MLGRAVIELPRGGSWGLGGETPTCPTTKALLVAGRDQTPQGPSEGTQPPLSPVWRRRRQRSKRASTPRAGGSLLGGRGGRASIAWGVLELCARTRARRLGFGSRRRARRIDHAINRARRHPCFNPRFQDPGTFKTLCLIIRQTSRLLSSAKEKDDRCSCPDPGCRQGDRRARRCPPRAR